MKCPKCGAKINPAKVMGKMGGRSKSPAKQAAARKNGKKGGRPKCLYTTIEHFDIDKAKKGAL